MTVYALRLQNGTDTAARVRMADLLGLTPSGNLSARGGIRPGPTAGVVAVTAGTMQVTVQPFMAYVDGGVSDTQGGYPFVSDAVVTLTLAAGHGTLSRTDVIAAVVRDSGYDSSGTLSATVEVVQGTPGAGAPALPTNATPLRNVVVPAGASAGTGGLTSGALSTDRRAWLASLGGVVPVASQTERDTLPAIDGTVVYRHDTDTYEGRAGGAWTTIAPLSGWVEAYGGPDTYNHAAPSVAGIMPGGGPYNITVPAGRTLEVEVQLPRLELNGLGGLQVWVTTGAGQVTGGYWENPSGDGFTVSGGALRHTITGTGAAVPVAVYAYALGTNGGSVRGIGGQQGPRIKYRIT